MTIQNVQSGLCVDTGNSTGNNVLVQQPCSGSNGQSFTILNSPATGYYYLYNAASKKCWDVTGGSGSAGATIQQYTCTAVWPEYFQLSAVSGTAYRILSGNMSNGCVGVAGGSTAAGAQIQQNTCNGSANQSFTIARPGSQALSVSVSPTSATVPSVGTQQFNATVTGSTNTAVTWSTTAGTISSSGRFTAPSVTSNTTVTVTARSQANTSASASANLVVTAQGTYLLSANPSSLNFGNVNTSSSASARITLTNTGNSNVTISGIAVSGAGFSASGVSGGTTLTPNQSAALTVNFAPSSGGSTSGSITVSSNATNSPATIALTGSAVAGVINVTSYGATGNGSTDDTAAIRNAIAALSSGNTLLFPCGTYRTSSQLFLNLSNVTIDGSGCATIRNTGSGTVFVIGGSGNGNPNYGAAVALSATANELATSFSTVSSLGVGPGDLVLLKQGGQDSSTGSGHTVCDVSGCRGELAQVASVSGNVVTVTTALHDTYSPSINAATAQKILNPLTGVTVKNLVIDGNGSNTYGLAVAGVANSTVSGVAVKNVQGAALLNRGDFNVSWNNVTVTGAGSAQCGSAAWFEAQGNLAVNGMSISSLNPGSPYSGCLYNGAFGFELIQSANSTIDNLTVDATGAYGRPFKTTAARHNTFNSLTVKNSPAANNGISVEYYSSRNTYNGCVVTNNGAGTGTGTGNAGINTFGNFNQWNKFNNCTVSGNGNVQVLFNNWDALRLGQDSYNSIIGGAYTGSNSSTPVIYVIGSNLHVNGATISGPGTQGLYLGSTNGCINSNTFRSGLGAAIWSGNNTNVGGGNLLNLLSSNLVAGACTGN